MRVCALVKYPPIEGGVSTQAYWLLRGLASHGHQVFVVTNARGVESEFRISLTDEDTAWLQSFFMETGGSVTVRHTERYSRAMMHVPRTTPHVTQLASIATQMIEESGCDVIYSSYFEPYGVAGYLASIWTNRPLVLQHAGSDVGRLMNHRDLSTAYANVLRGATRIVASARVEGRLLGLGIPAERITVGIRHVPPPEVFNPQAPALDVMECLRRYALEDSLAVRDFDMTLPTIGIYGKVGEAKGSFDLIAALGALRREGSDFNFLVMSHGAAEPEFRQALASSGLADCTYILPFLPNWRVPAFIRACTAVCFLERAFPIGIHQPIIAQEVIACGTCLVLSGEIARKQPFRDLLRDEETVLLVQDPTDHEELAGKLRLVLHRRAAALEIGRLAHQEIAVSFRSFDSGIEHYENVMEAAIREHGVQAGRPVDVSPPIALASLLPTLFSVLGEKGAEALADFDVTAGKGDASGAAFAFLRHVASRWTDLFHGSPEELRDILDYEFACLEAAAARRAGLNRDAFEATLTSCVTQVDNDSHLLRSNWARVAELRVDPLEVRDAPSATDRWLRETRVLCVCRGNGSVSTFRVGKGTLALWRLCDGSTLGEVKQRLRECGLGVPDEEVQRQVLSLAREGALLIAEARPNPRSKSEVPA